MTKDTTIVRSVVGFERWLEKASRGDVCMYYVGNLMAAVQALKKHQKDSMSKAELDQAFARISRAKARGKCALKAAEDGLVVLTQKRWGDRGHKWAYLATCSKPETYTTHLPTVPVRYGRA